MVEPRPFPPSPRRLALAQRAGLHAASPLLVGGLATAAATLAFVVLGTAAARQLGAWIVAACTSPAHVDAGPHATAVAPLQVTGLVGAVAALALPLLGLVALAALVAHLAQTRAPWLPRRRIEGAPSLPGGAGPRTRRAAFDLLGVAAIGGTAFAWLWAIAPRLARLIGSAAITQVPSGTSALFLTGALATFAIAWVSLGVLDALVRHVELTGALFMTPREQRDDIRAAGLDPRWRKLRASLNRSTDLPTAVAGSSFVILGDDLAIAIAWDSLRRPIPTRTATGRRARATQLLALARRHRLPIHRDPDLARALIGSDGPVPDRHWPRLAHLAAASRP